MPIAPAVRSLPASPLPPFTPAPVRGLRRLRCLAAAALMLAGSTALAQDAPKPAAPVPEAAAQNPAPAEAAKPDASPASPRIDPALLTQAAEFAFVGEAKRAYKAKTFNTNRNAVSRARQSADVLIAVTPEIVRSASAWNWAIAVETRPEPIAYVIPGGKIMVTTGFFDRMRLTDDEFAALLAHAIAHALMGHDTNLAVARYNLARGTNAPDPDVNRAALELSEYLGKVVMTPHYDETDERTADAVALDMLARAGINPNAAIDAWNKVMRAGGATAPEFLAMHPVRPDRIAEMETQLPRR